MPFDPDATSGLIFLTLCYTVLCAKSPYGLCRKCQGWGARVHVSRFSRRVKRGRTCRRCRGHGRRLRIGRRLYNAFARLRGQRVR
jgi:hypothetical protein